MQGHHFAYQGLDLPLDAISQELRIEPTHTHHRGEPGMLREPLPFDMWMLKSPLSERDELELHLVWLAGPTLASQAIYFLPKQKL